ncbi:MAG TPA: efflux RND transporter permease subunit [Chloroflexota bacterium]
MGLTRIAINRPLAMLMLILGLVIMGGVAFTLLKVDRMPNISMPFVFIGVSYPGATPSDVEDLVVKPLEQTVSGISGVDTISSDAGNGSGSVRISFVENWSADQAIIDVERRVAAIRSRLPSDAGDPNVNKADPNSMPIMNISLTGNLPLDQLYSLASDVVQPKLQSVPGVADVAVNGGLIKEVRIRADYAKLEAYGLSTTSISNAITRENVNSPGGVVQQGRTQLNVRSVGLFQSADELGSLIITNSANGPVRLRDVATVSEGFKDRTSYQRLNGQESVGLSITKASEANSLQVASDIKKAIANVGNLLPAGAQIVISNDNSRFTQAALDSIERDLVLAVLLCGLVLLLFLHAWRNTLIVLLAIPTSLISTFLVMFVMGLTLNTISMMALALTIGILVDDSIVVLENIHRHLHLGNNRRDAALKGRSEIGLAAIAITMTDIVVYLPVAFMSGAVGRLLKEYGLTIATATLFSLFISFTLTPMLASRIMKEKENGGGSRWNPFAWFPAWWEGGYGKVANGYRSLLGVALRARPLVLLVALAAFVGAVALIQLHLLGVEYAPAEDDNQISVNLSLPTGSGLDAANQAATQLEAMLAQQVPEIQYMFTSVGGGGGPGFGGGGRGASISLQLVDKSQRQRSVFDIQNQIRRMGTSIPDATVRTSIQSPLGFGGGFGGVSVDVQGDDLSVLSRIAGQVEQAARRIPGVTDVRNPDISGEPEIRAVMDHAKMAEMGVTSQQVSQTIRTLISGTLVAELRPENKDQEDITLVAGDTDRLDLARLQDMPIVSATGGVAATSPTGSVVRLGQVASIVRTTGPVSISRTNRQRVVSVTATVDGSRPMGDVANDLRLALKNIPLPDGYSTNVSGQVRQMDSAMGALTSALTLSVILIYMLLVALFESWLHPLAILFSLPVSAIGAFGGLFITGNTLNIFSMIGMIMLMGLVAKNAILLVDFTNTLRSRGFERREALLEAGRTRLRPILMTTMTVVAAMTPLALKLESGAESRAPMAVVVIGGVISSTLLTLVLVPTIYTYLDDFQNMLKAPRPFFLKRKGPSAGAVPAPVEVLEGE